MKPFDIQDNLDFYLKVYNYVFSQLDLSYTQLVHAGTIGYLSTFEMYVKYVQHTNEVRQRIWYGPCWPTNDRMPDLYHTLKVNISRDSLPDSFRTLLPRIMLCTWSIEGDECNETHKAIIGKTLYDGLLEWNSLEVTLGYNGKVLVNASSLEEFQIKMDLAD